MWQKVQSVKLLHVAKIVSLHSQRLNLCSASLSGSELSCRPLCSPLFDLVHSWKLLPPSLTHSCVFEAGEHPHTHTTTDPGSWLVLNPWQGAFSLNIKDPHLRACRHDSHPDLSYSQQATWTSNSLEVAGATGGRRSDTAMVWAELCCICHPAMWTCKKKKKKEQCTKISNRPICPTRYLLPCWGSFPDDKSACALFSTMSNHSRRARRAE